MIGEFFRAEALPVLQNRTFATGAEAKSSPTGDVVLVQDRCTGLVRNAAFDPSLLTYDADYQNEQACSPMFRRHLDDVAIIIARYFKGKSVIEVGCGKGYFLEFLRSLGYDIVGIDPAYEGNNPGITTGRFERGLGLRGDGIVLRHVLEHIPEPAAFLSEIANANAGRGRIYIEVPCFDWILSHRAWFDIFYEHVNYFRAIDFEHLFGRIYELGHLFGGQYLYVVADLASLRQPQLRCHKAVAIPPEFFSSIDRAITIIRNSRRKRSAVWGAASKGVIFSVYLQRAGIELNEAIDINPAKQGRFLPCSGVQVSSPEKVAERLEPRDVVFVMNSNYLNEVVAQSRRRYTYFTVDHG